MLKTMLIVIVGFITGFLLTENAQIIRHSIPRDGSASGNIIQFILILGIGNSNNTFEVNVGDEMFTDEDEENDE